ncbi:MAG TPA: ABC transporter ATP-binding protein, partial [Chromatiales bacterium]|nr:ABC transporter ATP-binding protein [Chromatiales bacterium]
MPAGTEHALVVVEDLHFSRGNRPIFRGLDLTIPRGAVT